MKRVYAIMLLCLMSESSLGCEEYRHKFGFFTFDCYNLTSASELPDRGNQNFLIMTVNIQSSNISPIPKSAFAKYSGLTILRLKYIQDLDIEPGTFSGFNHLTDMTITNNAFENNTVPEHFFIGAGHLHTLHLDNNSIEQIHPGLFRDLKWLIILDLSNNNIEKFLYGTFEKLKTLTHLDISNNKLTTLHQQVLYPLVRLYQLLFQNNQISSFNGEELTKHMNFKRVEMNSNPWNCADLYLIDRAFKKKNVIIEDASSFDVENVHGIACIVQKEKSELQTPQEIVIDPKIRSILNEDFKNSEFYNFFHKDYNMTNFFRAINHFKVMQKN